jgi:hypothetical protein
VPEKRGSTRHENFEAFIFFADEVLHGDFDVFKGKVGGHYGEISCPREWEGRVGGGTALDGATGMHSSSGDAWHIRLDKQRTQARGTIFLFPCPDRRGKIIRVQPAGDLTLTKAPPQNTEN